MQIIVSWNNGRAREVASFDRHGGAGVQNVTGPATCTDELERTVCAMQVQCCGLWVLHFWNCGPAGPAGS